MTRIIPL